MSGISRDGYFLAIAGLMSEEFRVERALCEAGSWPRAEYRDGVVGTLRAFAAEMLSAVTLRYPGEPIDRRCTTVLSAFSTLTTLGGYLAAEQIASGGNRSPETTSPMWRRYVGPMWPTLLKALEPIPSAAGRRLRAELDHLGRPPVRPDLVTIDSEYALCAS